MERPLSSKCLATLCGLALVAASTGCRERNLQVPPPTHYSDASPGTTPYGSVGDPTMGDPAGMNPYAPEGIYGDYSSAPDAGYVQSTPSDASYGAYDAGAAAYDPNANAYGSSTGAPTYPAESASPYAEDLGAMTTPSYDPYAGIPVSPEPDAPSGAATYDPGSVDPMSGTDPSMSLPPLGDGLPEMP